MKTMSVRRTIWRVRTERAQTDCESRMEAEGLCRLLKLLEPSLEATISEVLVWTDGYTREVSS